jgi:hypothetical protein
MAQDRLPTVESALGALRRPGLRGERKEAGGDAKTLQSNGLGRFSVRMASTAKHMPQLIGRRAAEPAVGKRQWWVQYRTEESTV